MKRQKGLVLEIKKKSVIVLTPDGQFLEHKISGQPPVLGSEIEFISYRFDKRKILMLEIAAVLILTFIPLLVLQLFIYPQIPVAYVTVDINPSIELGLNKYERVISAKGLNEDGIVLLNKVDLHNLPVENALEVVTEEAIKEKYINPEKENAVIISYSKNEATKKSVPKKPSGKEPETEPVSAKVEVLESKVKQVIERNQQQAIVEIVSVSPKVRNAADRLGLSTGKYTLMLEAWDEGLDISLESIKGNSIITVIKENGVNPGEFISHLKEKSYDSQELEELALKYASRFSQLAEKEMEKMYEQDGLKGKQEKKESDPKSMAPGKGNFHLPLNIFNNKEKDISTGDRMDKEFFSEIQDKKRKKDDEKFLAAQREIEQNLLEPSEILLEKQTGGLDDLKDEINEADRKKAENKNNMNAEEKDKENNTNGRFNKGKKYYDKKHDTVQESVDGKELKNWNEDKKDKKEKKENDHIVVEKAGEEKENSNNSSNSTNKYNKDNWERKRNNLNNALDENKNVLDESNEENAFEEAESETSENKSGRENKETIERNKEYAKFPDNIKAMFRTLLRKSYN
ncbi:MAG: anti-sigma factor domain-containing protein [Clostridia bacterium]|nr:anti-sigma factor domain-containing protein [Clostridia bacterium]